MSIEYLCRYTQTVLEAVAETAPVNPELMFMVDAASNATISLRGDYVKARLEARNGNHWRVEASSVPLQTGGRYDTLDEVCAAFLDKKKQL